MLSFALFAELGYFHFIFQNESTLWKLLSFMQSLLGKEEGRKSKGNTVFLWYPPRCFIKSLFIIQTLYIKVVYYTATSSFRDLYIFSPQELTLCRRNGPITAIVRVSYAFFQFGSFVLRSLFSTIWIGKKAREISCPINSNS